MTASGETNGNETDEEAFATYDQECEALAASTVEIVTPPTVIRTPTLSQCRRDWFQRLRNHRQSPEFARFEQIQANFRQQYPRSPLSSTSSVQSITFLGSLDPEPDLWCCQDELDQSDLNQCEMIADPQDVSIVTTEPSIVVIREIPMIDLVSTHSRNIGN